MVVAGIRAIRNFTPVILTVPPSVIVEEVQLASSLVVLSSKLARMLIADRLTRRGSSSSSKGCK